MTMTHNPPDPRDPINAGIAAASAASARKKARLKRPSAFVSVILAVGILIPSLLGFGNKFAEFLQLYRGDVEGEFAISPVVNYLLASLGFFCLFCWAMFQGMFRDIEEPKHQFLETEAQLDAIDVAEKTGLPIPPELLVFPTLPSPGPGPGAPKPS